MKHLKVFFTVVIAVMALTFTAQAQNKEQKEKKDAEITFSVQLHCKDCVSKLESALPYAKGVKDLKISLEKQTVWFKYDPAKTNKTNLIAEIEKRGYEAKELEVKK